VRAGRSAACLPAGAIIVRRPVLAALALGLLVALGLTPGAPAARAATASDPKVVIVVGPVESMTSTYRSYGDEAYAEAIKYTSNVVKVYSPNATWSAVKAAVQGASVVLYLGHGNGLPSPYNATLTTYAKTQVDGFGLNAAAGQGDSNVKYYGESVVAADVRLAPNAVVLLSHLCYAAGNSEPGKPEPTVSIAHQRIDNFGAGFIQAGARAVIAETHFTPATWITSLFTTHQPIDQAWQDFPRANGHEVAWASARSAGFTSSSDPDTATSGFYRSIVYSPGLTTDMVTGASAADGSPDPAPAVAVAPATYVPLSPARILDTRHGTGLSGAFASQVARTFVVAGKGGVPTGAIGVTGNLTVTGQTTAGFVFLGPDATNSPTSSTLNFPAGDNRANGVTVALGAGGKLSATFVSTSTSATAQVIFDVTGYFVP
jgi:hypothetical protein